MENSGLVIFSSFTDVTVQTTSSMKLSTSLLLFFSLARLCYNSLKIEVVRPGH